MDIFFTLYYISFPIFMLGFLKLGKISIFRFSIISVVITFLFIFSYIGLLPLYFHWIDYRYEIGVQDRELITEILLISSWTIFSLVLGYITARDFLGCKKDIPNPSSIISMNSKEIFCLTLPLILCISVLILFLTKFEQIALFVALTDGASEAAVVRSTMTNAFTGKFHWYNLIINHLLTLITYTMFCQSLITKKIIPRLIFILALTLSIFVAIMTVQKGPIVYLLIGLFFTYTLVRHAGRYPIGGLFLLLTFTTFTLSLLYMFFMGVQNIGASLESIISRAFTGQLTPAYYYLEFFPYLHDFLFGKSFPNVGGIFPYEPYHLTKEIMVWKFPQDIEKGIVGTAPTTFWGEIYANFGYFGISLAPFCVGALLLVISNFLGSLRPTPLNVGLLVWIALHYKNLAVSGLGDFLVDFYLIFILLFWAFLNGFMRLISLR